MRKHFNVLSIDGGGVRGIIPASFLAELEKRLQAKTLNKDLRLADIFDLFVGTSTGGILAMGYVIPDAQQRPKYTAADGIDFYTKDAPTVFKQSFIQQYKILEILEGAENFVQLFQDESHAADGLEAVLKRVFGDAKLADVLKPTIISSFDLGQYKPAFFKSYRDEDKHHFLRDIGRLTSAAPTYFEPLNGETLQPKIERGVFIDGGIMMNNPVVTAIAEAIACDARNNRTVNIVSVSCGDTKQPLQFDEVKDMKTLLWARPLIGVLMDAAGLANHFQAKHIVPQIAANASNDWGKGMNASKYFRYFIDLYRVDDEPVMDMDDSRPVHISYLKAKGKEMIEKYDEDGNIDYLVSRLLQEE